LNAEEKFPIDVASIALIIAIWVRWHRNGLGSNSAVITTLAWGHLLAKNRTMPSSSRNATVFNVKRLLRSPRNTAWQVLVRATSWARA
jgi:hypothetical protein